MTDLLAQTASLVDIPSVSHHEDAMADHVEAALAGVPWLSVERVGRNVVARTSFGHERRLILAGHIDTVPPNGNERSRIEGDTLWGLGSADMKSGVAVFIELARTVSTPACDVSYVFYECEEVEQEHNGLKKMLASRPELLEGDAAILGEPTSARIEAGCQGSLRVDVRLAGERAHTARPWMGRNAIHRLGPLLDRVASYESRRPTLNGCEFREAVQAVTVSGGVAGNVVPDSAVVTINHRFAPDRSLDEAVASVRSLVGDAVDESAGDVFELVDWSLPAPPSLDHPLLGALSAAVDAPPVAKLGWTDVAFFAEAGIPATNFGPGDPTVAHTAGEHVTRSEIERVYAVLERLLSVSA